MSERGDAFRAVREVVGDEICPDVGEIIKGLDDPTLVAKAARARTTTHNLRHMLVALLLWLRSPDRERCPNCEEKLPVHSARCMLNALIEEYQRHFRPLDE